MSVNLSPLGGAGAQFFTNDGVPLTGGLLYTYLAGTSTPATTYTSSSGITALANPIILDAAGRVPTGEIWLADGISYKFVLKDATDVLIATWDGLSGINSNFIAFTAQEETATATAGQTVFNLSLSYLPATNNLSVFVNGSNQIVSVNYLETDDNTVTFLTGLNVGDVVKFSTATPVATNAMDAVNVSYTPAGAGAVTTNVQAKLREIVSVTDYGAVGDGTTDDTTAIQNAIDSGNSSIFFPNGTYKITDSLTISDSQITLYGDGGLKSSPVIQASANTFSIIKATGTGTQSLVTLRNLTLKYGTYGFESAVALSGGVGILDRTTFENVTFDQQVTSGIYADATQKMIIGTMLNCLFSYCVGGIKAIGGNFSIWNIQSCKFEGLNSSSIYLANINDSNSCGSAITINNCRFEATNGVSTGYYVCYFRSAQNLNFTNNYFESTSTSLIKLDSLYVYSVNNTICNNFFGVVNGQIDIGDGNLRSSIHDNYFLTGVINATVPSGTVLNISIYNNTGITSAGITNFLIGQITNCDLALTWTPAIKPDGTGTAWTTSSASGTYKIYNGVVTLQGSIVYTVKTGTSSYAFLTGMPVPAVSTQFLSGVSIISDTNTYTMQISTSGNGGFYKNNTPGVSGALIGSELGPSTGTMSINVTYSI
jgi:hypothetical protein